jgi:hypothetical protein
MERASGKQPRKKVPPEAAADGHAAAKGLPYGDGRARMGPPPLTMRRVSMG